MPYFLTAPLNRTDQSAMYLTVTNSRKQPSPGWGRWREATDEGETGEWNRATQSSRRSSLPLRGGRWREATDEGGRTVLTSLPFHRNSNAISEFRGTTTVAFPGWWKKNCKQFSAPATDEGEIGEWNRATQSSRRRSLPLRGGRWRRRRRMRAGGRRNIFRAGGAGFALPMSEFACFSVPNGH